ncbi:MAG TPA: sugar ABC transporter permease [Reyranella sp.]|nr:sugar ABC transporter permease [Reyranella sp.]
MTATPAAQAAKKKRRPRNRWRATGWKFAAPGLSVLALVLGLPLVYAVLLSISSFNLLNPVLEPFVGLENFETLMVDPYFWNSLAISFEYTVATVTGAFGLGLFIAVLLTRVVRLKAIYFAMLTVPVALAPVSAGLIWHMLLAPERGIANQLIGRAGLPAPDWLGNPDLALWTLVFVELWQQVAFVVLILSAGLAALPKRPYEAAEVDGAGRAQQFWYLTLPMLRPVAAVAILIQLINVTRSFDLVYVLTRGGPEVATDLLSIYTYRQAFLGLSLHDGAAASFVLLMMVLVLSVIFFRLVTRRA